MADVKIELDARCAIQKYLLKREWSPSRWDPNKAMRDAYDMATEIVDLLTEKGLL